MKLTPKRIEILRFVQERIKSDPLAYNQRTYTAPDVKAECGTACCIAGWVCLSNPAIKVDQFDFFINGKVIDPSQIAQGMLGLSYTEVGILFDSFPEDKWPDPFRSEWAKAPSREARADIAIRYLERIIQTGEVL